MSEHLRVLIVEDSEDDATLLVRELKRGGYDPESKRVDTPKDFLTELENGGWDIIISDYSMPSFSGMDALEILKKSGADLPFILISGTIGEDVAVEALLAGAHDYIIKGSWARLIPAIKRELQEVEIRKERKKAEEALLESEERYRSLTEATTSIIWTTDPEGKFVAPQLSWEKFTGQPWSEHKGFGWFKKIHPDDIERVQEVWEKACKGQSIYETWGRVWNANLNQWRDFTVRAVPIKNPDGSCREWIGVIVDITKRKKAEKVAARLGRILEKSSNEIYIFDDKTFRFLQVNDGARNNLGYSMEELEALTPFDIKQEYTKKSFSELIAPLKNGDVDITIFETVHKRKDRSLYPVEVQLSYFASETPPLFVAIIQDITERKKAEEELKESEMRFRSMAQTANDAVIVADSGGNIISWNLAATSIFGYTEAEALQIPITILMPERFKEKHLSGMERFKATGNKTIIGKRVEVIGLRRHGDEFPLELSLASWKRESEYYFSAIIRDITEKKKAETSLKILKNSIEHATDIVVITDTKGVIEYVNPAVQRVTGYTPQELIGKKTSIFKSEVHDDEFYKSMWKTIQSGGVWKGEMVNSKKTGENYNEEMTIAPVFGENEEIVNFVSIKRDVSKEKKLDKELKQSFEELQKAMDDLQSTQSQLIRSEKLASMGQLSAGVAHEIKNPLNIISTSVQLLKMDDDVPEDNMRAYDTILDQVNRAVKITDNLREFARERKPEITDVEAEGFINKILSLVEYEMKLENISFELSFESPQITIRGDEDQLAQVFLNIINNARDSMNEKQDRYSYEELQKDKWKGLIAINVSISGSMALFILKDTGLGMSQETLTKLFDPFFTTKAEGKGTGLGMSIAYGIIENHGGTIVAKSEEGKGSKFSVQLPLAIQNQTSNNE